MQDVRFLFFFFSFRRNSSLTLGGSLSTCQRHGPNLLSGKGEKKKLSHPRGGGGRSQKLCTPTSNATEEEEGGRKFCYFPCLPISVLLPPIFQSFDQPLKKGRERRHFQSSVSPSSSLLDRHVPDRPPAGAGQALPGARGRRQVQPGRSQEVRKRIKMIKQSLQLFLIKNVLLRWDSQLFNFQFRRFGKSLAINYTTTCIFFVCFFMILRPTLEFLSRHSYNGDLGRTAVFFPLKPCTWRSQ